MPNDIDYQATRAQHTRALRRTATAVPRRWAMDQLPIACTLSPAEFESARGDLLPSLATIAREWQERPNGLALRFDSAPERGATIARTIDRERQCCRFL